MDHYDMRLVVSLPALEEPPLSPVPNARHVPQPPHFIMSQPPPQANRPSPYFAVPIPNLTVPPPAIAVPPPDFTVPPPDFTVPSPNFTVPPPNIMATASNITVPLPDIKVPPFFRASVFSRSSSSMAQGSAVPLLSCNEHMPSTSSSYYTGGSRNSAQRDDLSSHAWSAYCRSSSISSEDCNSPMAHSSDESSSARRNSLSLVHRGQIDVPWDRPHRSSNRDRDQHWSGSMRPCSRRRCCRVEQIPRTSQNEETGQRNDGAPADYVKKNRLNQHGTSKNRPTSINKNMKTENPTRKPMWCRSSPAEPYYTRGADGGGGDGGVRGTAELMVLSSAFREMLLAPRAAAEEPPRGRASPHRPASVESSSSEEEETRGGARKRAEARLQRQAQRVADELRRKQLNPFRLHPDLWFNERGMLNVGEACGCSRRARREGIHHGVFPGEGAGAGEGEGEGEATSICDPNSSNIGNLHHYRITISPPTNFLTREPTVILHDSHEFIFCGFSMFAHHKIENVPDCKFIRYKIEYTVHCEEDQPPTNFTINELNMFEEYLFLEILELVDYKPRGDSSCRFHFMPRFVRSVAGGGCEILSMCEVLKYLLVSAEPLVPHDFRQLDNCFWEQLLDRVKGMIVRNPDTKPSCLRLDHVDRPPRPAGAAGPSAAAEPQIVHFSRRPTQWCYAGNGTYVKEPRQYQTPRRAGSGARGGPSAREEERLRRRRGRQQFRRDVAVAVPSRGFLATGLWPDVTQHAMLIPVLTKHLRFHKSLESLERKLEYKFRSRSLLEQALTHTSYADYFGTNPDHARNSLTNCGARLLQYGTAGPLPHAGTRERGLRKQKQRMSDLGTENESESRARHNERLEFLGDSVLCFLTTLHLYLMFPERGEGALSAYRIALVQNNHLVELAHNLGLQNYMLVSHGSDTCQTNFLRHSTADCFEAIVGAVYLDGGITAADEMTSSVLWRDSPGQHRAWSRPREDPLSSQEPLSDRRYIPHYEQLQRLVRLEESTGIKFRHIRLLARAFTDQSIGFNNLTLGSNQRMEFFGDALLQLLTSDYLYRHFPEHQEGHLSMLRSCLVNNRSLATASEELGLGAYVITVDPAPSAASTSTKKKADLFEAFLGAIYLDKGIDYVEGVLKVCLFSKLPEVIAGGVWNDPKSRLQQLCLTLRTSSGTKPDLPYYRVVQVHGPSNYRTYTVVVYFRGHRLAVGTGRTVNDSEMAAAQSAVAAWNDGIIPILRHTKRKAGDCKKEEEPVPGPSGVNKHVNQLKARETHRYGLSDSDDSSDDGATHQTDNAAIDIEGIELATIFKEIGVGVDDVQAAATNGYNALQTDTSSDNVDIDGEWEVLSTDISSETNTK